MTTCLIGLVPVAWRSAFGTTPTPVVDLPPPHATIPAAVATNAKLSAAVRGRKVFLLRIDGQARGLLMQEERPRAFRRNRLERARRLVEVEEIRDAGGALVGGTEAAEIERLFNKFDDAAELVLGVHGTASGARRALRRIRGSDQHPDAKAETAQLI